MTPLVAVDTNILLDITRLKIPVFEQLEQLVGTTTFVVPIQVVQELQTLSTERTKTGVAARIALELIKKRGLKIVSATAMSGDEALRDLATKGYIIVTNDRALRQSLKNAPQRAIVVRQSKYLAWL